MADKLMLHTIDACTQTAGRDPRLNRKRGYNKQEILWLFIATAAVIGFIFALAGTAP